MSAWVYILECSDGSYYTGCTTNLSQRIVQHETGFYEGYTSSRLPIKLIWSQEFQDVRDAINAERQIKGWSRKKKEALMKGDFDLLHEFAQSKEMVQRTLRLRPAKRGRDCAQGDAHKSS
jgi:predicted GIY-YIG superfamily endonuclease